jgi:hypothetical protein
MPWQNNPAGLGVGKNYGTFNTGGSKGRLNAYGSTQEIVFEVTAEEFSRDYVASLFPNYLIEEVVLEVTQAFNGSATLALRLNNAGTNLNLTPLTVGKTKPSLASTSLLNATGTTAGSLAVVKGGTPTTGRARITVRYVA